MLDKFTLQTFLVLLNCLDNMGAILAYTICTDSWSEASVKGQDSTEGNVNSLT